MKGGRGVRKREKERERENDGGRVAGGRWGFEQVVRGGRGGRRRRNEALVLLPQ